MEKWRGGRPPRSRAITLLFSIFLIGASVFLKAQVPSGPLILNHVNLIDGTGSGARPDMRIWIVAGMIDKVEKAGAPLQNEKSGRQHKSSKKQDLR